MMDRTQRTASRYVGYPPLPEVSDPLAFTYERLPDDDGANVYTSRLLDLGMEFTIDVFDNGEVLTYLACDPVCDDPDATQLARLSASARRLPRWYTDNATAVQWANKHASELIARPPRRRPVAHIVNRHDLQKPTTATLCGETITTHALSRSEAANAPMCPVCEATTALHHMRYDPIHGRYVRETQ